MVERFGLAVLVLAAIVLLAYVVRWGVRRWQARLVARQRVAPGQPMLLYFSGPWCVLCRQQEPMLEQARRLSPVSVQLRKVDVAGEAELARRFGVLTVPTTVVIDRHGAVRAINNGLVSAQALLHQLRDC